MDEEGALEKLEGRDDEEVILAVRSFGKKALQACYQSDCNYTITVSGVLEREDEVSQEYHSIRTLLAA